MMSRLFLDWGSFLVGLECGKAWSREGSREVCWRTVSLHLLPLVVYMRLWRIR